jgi:hypothetical protein
MTNGESASEDELRARLEAIVRAAPGLMQVLHRARELDLPDWLIMSGAVYQPVLNHLTGRPSDYGLKDYDLGYFDASDTSYDAEDVVIRQVAADFEEPLRSLVEVRNQARVHLWFEGKYGEAYSPLASTGEALGRFVAPMFAVGVRLLPGGELRIEAPFGVADLFALRLRPNRLRPVIRSYERIAAAAKARWPELEVEPREA